LRENNKQKGQIVDRSNATRIGNPKTDRPELLADGWVILKNDTSHIASPGNLIFWQVVHISRPDPDPDFPVIDFFENVSLLLI
jgi:hypothetical protein